MGKMGKSTLGNFFQTFFLYKHMFKCIRECVCALKTFIIIFFSFRQLGDDVRYRFAVKFPSYFSFEQSLGSGSSLRLPFLIELDPNQDRIHQFWVGFGSDPTNI
jgi:hypothetical protein